jgi:hypothetical protein
MINTDELIKLQHGFMWGRDIILLFPDNSLITARYVGIAWGGLREDGLDEKGYQRYRRSQDYHQFVKSVGNEVELYNVPPQDMVTDGKSAALMNQPTLSRIKKNDKSRAIFQSIVDVYPEAWV